MNWYRVEVRRVEFLGWEWRMSCAFNMTGTSRHGKALTKWGAKHAGQKAFDEIVAKDTQYNPWEIVIDHSLDQSTDGI